MTLKEAIRDNLCREYMRHDCLSVKEFAEITGTNTMQMSKYMSGFAVPTLAVALRLSRALDITVEQLTEGGEI